MNTTVRSKCGSSSGGVATSRRPFVGSVPGNMSPVCPIATRREHRRRIRPDGGRHTCLHDHAHGCMLMQMSVRVGVIGASGYTGAELMRLIAAHPDFELVLATGDSMAGRRAADLYPSLEIGYPNLRYEPFDVAGDHGARPRVPRPAARGIDGARAAARGHGRLRGRPLGGLPPEGQLAVPGVLRIRTHAADVARRRGVRSAGTAPRRPRGCPADRHAGLPRHRRHARPAPARGGRC